MQGMARVLSLQYFARMQSGRLRLRGVASARQRTALLLVALALHALLPGLHAIAAHGTPARASAIAHIAHIATDAGTLAGAQTDGAPGAGDCPECQVFAQTSAATPSTGADTTTVAALPSRLLFDTSEAPRPALSERTPAAPRAPPTLPLPIA
jgi:hypothetical protein